MLVVGADAAEALAEDVDPDTADVTCDKPCDPPTLLLLLLLLPLIAADGFDTPGPLDDDACCWVWFAEDMTCSLVVIAGHAAGTSAPDVADVARDTLGCPPMLLLLPFNVSDAIKALDRSNVTVDSV